jgi:hypothetical protein
MENQKIAEIADYISRAQTMLQCALEAVKAVRDETADYQIKKLLTDLANKYNLADEPLARANSQLHMLKDSL